jgi:type IV pilus assembly protein PilE
MNHCSPTKPRNPQGFTLLEMMIVIAIIGILAIIAIPSYKSHVTNAKIPDAFVGLNDLAAKAQNYYADTKNYDGYPCTTAASSANYTFTCTPGNGTGMAVQTIVFRATGKNDLTGYVYTLNESSAKTTSQPGGITSNNCWMKTTGGSC